MMRVFAVFLVVLAQVIAQEVVLVPREVTIDAAFTYDDDVFLISGDEYMAISPDGFERYLKVRTGDTQVPSDVNIQAAIHWPFKPIVYYYGNDTSYKSNQDGHISKVKHYGKARQFLQDGGPDAAAFMLGQFYVFKGCEYVSQKGTLWHLGEPKNVTDVGLPCDIDAAWTDRNRKGMTLLKGDNIWTWSEVGVIGPTPFEDEYIIWSWQLKPVPDERFIL